MITIEQALAMQKQTLTELKNIHEEGLVDIGDAIEAMIIDCSQNYERTIPSTTSSFDLAVEQPEMPSIEVMEDETVKTIYDNRKVLEAWMAKLKGHMISEALNGNEAIGYKLRRGRPLRKYKSGVDVEKVLSAVGIDKEQWYTKKLITPTDAIKLVEKDKIEILEAAIDEKISEPSLIKIDHDFSGANSGALAPR